MGKIIAWLIVIFVVLLALRIVNMRNARRRAGEAAAPKGPARSGARAAAMVRCARCGTYVPRDEAREVRGGFVCIGGECAAHA